MSDIRPAADLVREAFQRVEGANIVEPEALVIWGGIFPAASLGDFLSAWHSLLIERMPWRMVEFVDRFTILRASVNDAALSDSEKRLERARLFGPAGDLDLRRDRLAPTVEQQKAWGQAFADLPEGQEVDVFRWRFIGDSTQAWPALPDAWQYPIRSWPAFRVVEQRYYLWHADDRRVNAEWVGGAGLIAKGERLIQRQYLYGGRIEFVRYIGFESEVEHG